MVVHLLGVLSVIGPSSEHSFFSLNFAMSSSSGAAQSSKAIGLIAEYLKKPENQAEAMAVWLKLSLGGFKETTVHLGSAGAGRFTPLYV